MRPRFFFFAGLLVAACAIPAAGEWQPAGMSGGGSMFFPGISPLDPNIILAACDMNDEFVSSDGGQTWKILDFPGAGYRIVRTYPAFHPGNSNIIFWGSDRLLVSTDRGQTWAEAHSSGYSGNLSSPSAIAIDHDNPSLIFVAYGRRPRNGSWETDGNALFRSTDGGTSFEELTSFPSGSSVTGIHIDRTSSVSSRKVIVATTHEAYVSNDGGDNWSDSSSGITRAWLYSFAGASNPSSGQITLVITAGNEGGAFISTDGAASWNFMPGLHTDWAYQEAAMAEGDTNVIYVSTDVEGDEKIYRSGDRGASFSLLSDAADPADAGWQNPYWGMTGYIRGMAVSASDSNRVIFTDQSTVFVSSNAGAVFHQHYTTPAGSNTWVSDGLGVTTVWDLCFHPADPTRVYGCYTDQGLWYSFDSGAAWSVLKRAGMFGIDGSNNCYGLGFDSGNPKRIYAALSELHDLHVNLSENTASYTGSIAVSNDYGVSWTQLGGGLPGGIGTSIAVDESSPQASRTVYASVCGYGVYKSIDGGNTWNQVNNGISGSLNAWKLKFHGGKLYLAVLQSGYSGHHDGGLYVSDDGAASWTKLGASQLVSVADIAFSPAAPDTIYTACYNNQAATTSADGIYRSTDAGSSWDLILAGSEFFAVEPDPAAPDILYAGSSGTGGLWKSADGGENWWRIADFPFESVLSITVHNQQVWVGTFGAGILKSSTSDNGEIILQSASGKEVLDVELKENDPTNNFGDATDLNLYWDGSPANAVLLYFNLDALPQNLDIQSARMELYLGSIDGDETLRMERMTTGWTEAGATWQQAQPGAPWTTPGAGDDAVLVNDYDSLENGWFSVDITSIVQAWRSGQETNYGFRLTALGISGAKYFEIASSESTAETRRPRLVISTTDNGSSSPGKGKGSSGCASLDTSGKPYGFFLALTLIVLSMWKKFHRVFQSGNESEKSLRHPVNV